MTERHTIPAMERALKHEERVRERLKLDKSETELQCERLSLWLDYLCLYLDDAERIELYDWSTANTLVVASASAPSPELAVRNLDFLCECVWQAIEEANQLTDESVVDARTCLNALDHELEVPLSIDALDDKSEIARVVSRMIQARSALRGSLSIANAKLRLAANRVVRACSWSQYMKVQAWLGVFEQAGCPISDDTLKRRIDAGEYRQHPDSRRGRLSLDLDTLPEAVRAQLRKNAATTPQMSANGG